MKDKNIAEIGKMCEGLNALTGIFADNECYGMSDLMSDYRNRLKKILESEAEDKRYEPCNDFTANCR